MIYERAGTWYCAAGPTVSLSVGADQVTARAGTLALSVGTDGQPMACVAEALEALPASDWRVYGIALFELGHVLHGDASRAGRAPLLQLIVPSVEAELRPGEARVRAAVPDSVPRMVAVLARAAAAGPVAGASYSAERAAALVNNGVEAYGAAVTKVVNDIRAGRLDKAIISRVLPLPEADSLDLTASYLAGRRSNTPARSFLLNLGGWRAAGFSPETVIEIDADGRVSTQPLAGTRAFGADQAVNGRLRAELLSDPKEIHEHAISVRLACRELDSVCEEGSVVVSEFMTVRERGSVQHLASRVAGQLGSHCTPWAALGALFPAITATGVPKNAALEIISENEAAPRGLYSGAVFVACADGSLDAALVLRTVFQHDGRTWLQAGAGITGQSDPAREAEETCEKLRSVAPYLTALPSGEASPASAGGPPMS